MAPVMLLIAGLILLFEGRPVLFVQERMGKGERVFEMWKFRTMVVGAEGQLEKYKNLNEADGPVFKVRSDPRYTRVGKWLSWSGLDELLQLFNVVRGEMLLVGPRPLPVSEAKKVSKRDGKRFEVLPGITSEWVVRGTHKISFADWMKLDREYVRMRSVGVDVRIILATCWAMIGMIVGLIASVLRGKVVGVKEVGEEVK